MALQLVDIFGNLQPASGKTKSTGEYYKFVPTYKNFSYGGVELVVDKDYYAKPDAVTTDSWTTLNQTFTKQNFLSNGYTQINENTFSKPLKKNVSKIVFVSPSYITVAIKRKDDLSANVYINLQDTDIFKRFVSDKLDCFKQYDNLSGNNTIGRLANFYFSDYFDIQTFNSSRVNASNWEEKLLKLESELKQTVDSILKDVKDKVQSGTWKKQDVPSCFLPDPDPALPGPPTQTISGVTNKAPVVDNPNIKLPSQEVKGLDANSAQQAASKAQSVVSDKVSQAQGAVGGLTPKVEGITGQAQSALQGAQQSAGGVLNNLSSGVKGALGGGALGAGIGALAGGGKGALIGAGAGVVAGGIAGSVVDKLNPKGIKPDGLGKDWSPDKFSPESIAGNDKFVDPKTGLVGSTSKLAAGLKGGVLGGALGAGIGALAGGGKGALIGGLSGTTLGAGLSVGGVTGGTLAGAGLGGGIGAAVGGGKGALIGAVSGGAVGAAAAKLLSIQKELPKPNIPKPTNLPRIKTIKIPRPSDTKGATDLLNLPKSALG